MTFDTVILGGGISGLSLGYYLAKKGQTSFAILEGKERWGGNIFTDRLNACLLDIGPDSFLTTKPWARDLCVELGLESQFIEPKTAKLYLARHGRLLPFPSGTVFGLPRKILPFLLSPAIPFIVKFKTGMEFLFPPPVTGSDEDESVAAFIRRHFGQRAVDLLAEPILGGIYAGSTEEMSLLATFPNLRDLERTHGSIIRGFRAIRSSGNIPIFLSLKEGLGTLVDTLVQRLPEQNLFLGHTAQKIAWNEESATFSIACQTGQTFTCRNLVLSCSPGAAATLLFPPFAEILSQFPSVSTATIFFAFRKVDVPHPIKALGFVCPREGQQHILASTWVSSKFAGRAPEDIFLLRCFVGGRGNESGASLPENELVNLCTQELTHLMGIREEPLFTRVYRWFQSSPQYILGHPEKMHRLREALRAFPQLSLIGNAYEGVGIPDCVRLAKECSEKIH